MGNEFEQEFEPRFRIRKEEVPFWQLAIYELYKRKVKRDVKIVLWDEIKEEDIKFFKKD